MANNPRGAVHLVEITSRSGVLGAALLDGADLGEVARPLQIHVGGVALGGDFLRENRLADRPRPDRIPEFRRLRKTRL